VIQIIVGMTMTATHEFDAIIGIIMSIRAVLDTNILVAGFSSQSGASYALLEHAMSGRFVMLASPALWLEYEATLKRADIDDALNALASVVTPVQSHFLWRPQLRDPKDELVLEAAANGMARHLVTLNVRDFTPAAHTFGIAITNPAKLLNLVETSS
jgi:putative PIN family toxin of toxin-antitoxin system